MKLIKRFPKTIVLLLVCAFVIFSCDKDDSPSNQQEQNQEHDPTAFAQNFGSDISRTFFGSVVDINNNPVENATITIGSSIALTDSNGVFIIEDAPLKERFGYVKAEKAGFIHASRSIVPSDGANKVRFMMLPEIISGTTTSGTQETISLPNGSKVALEGDFIKPDGTAYSGSVNVILHHLDSADENMQVQMPGMLYAANSQNQERLLQTFGMLAVELRGDNGEDLNLAEGSTAEITVPLDASLLSDAPTTIPLWYFDEENGYWIEDGQATLVGNTYVGTVSHFSFWSCNLPSEFNLLTLNLFDENGNPLSNLFVILTRENSASQHGFVNENAYARGAVPSNEILDIRIYVFGFCSDNLMYSGTIGPISTDTTIDIVIPPNSNINTEKVIGYFNTCDGNPVNHGYVKLFSNGSYIGIIDEGNFEINILNCNSSNNFILEGIDADNFETTGPIEYTFTNAVTNVGDIQACNDIEEFVQYFIDETTYVFTTNIDRANLNLNFANPFLDIRVEVEFGCVNSFQGTLYESPYVGNYVSSSDPIDEIGFSIGRITSYECPDLIYSSSINNDINFHVTKLGDVGEYIDINFSGSYADYENDFVIRTVSGTIHVLRDE